MTNDHLTAAIERFLNAARRRSETSPSYWEFDDSAAADEFLASARALMIELAFPLVAVDVSDVRFLLAMADRVGWRQEKLALEGASPASEGECCQHDEVDHTVAGCQVSYARPGKSRYRCDCKATTGAPVFPDDRTIAILVADEKVKTLV